MSFPPIDHRLCRACDEWVDIHHNCKGTIQHYRQKNMEVKMATIGDEAKAYEPPQTLNIADLESVGLGMAIEEREAENLEGEKFRYKFTMIDGKEYRIPNRVLEEIQTILKLKPTVTKVKVNRTGSGKQTRYKVEALD